MTQQKSISFDLWGTLIKSNPDFSLAQEDLIREFTEVENWKQLKKEGKKIISYFEEKGVQTKREQVYKKILPNLSAKEIKDFISYSDELFLKYPPKLREPSCDLIGFLKHAGYRVYVSSNTTLIYGDTLSKIVYNNFDIVKSNCKFSDEVGVTKPSREMFNFPIKPTYHIGDNLITDGASQNFRIEHYHINEKQNFKTFLEYAKI